MRKNNCGYIEEFIYGYNGGELSAQETADFEKHFETCQTCREAVENDKAFLKFIKEGISKGPVPLDTIWEKIGEERYGSNNKNVQNNINKKANIITQQEKVLDLKKEERFGMGAKFMRIGELLKKKSFVAASIACLSALLISIAVISAMLMSGNGADTEAMKMLTSAEISKIKIIPTVSDKTGIDTKSEFKIDCGFEIKQEVLEKLLVVKPVKEYKLTKQSSKSYMLSFNSEMKSDVIYNIAIFNNENGAKRSWAFQTKRIFKVSRTLPRNMSTGVPIESGIEMTFSHDNLKDIEQYFEIIPKVNGRFEKHSKTIVFVPQKLEKGTVYKVTIKKGFGLIDNDESLLEDYTFSFQTNIDSPQSENEFFDIFSYNDLISNFTSKAVPVIEVWATQSYSNKDINVDVFKYKDTDDYINDLKKYDNIPGWANIDNSKNRFSTDSITKFTSFKTKLSVNNPEYYGTCFIVFPDRLQEGYYLLNITANGKTYQKHLQINDTAAYIMTSKEKILVWANNSVTGQSLKDTVVEQVGGVKAKTGEDGVAVLENSNSGTPNSGYSYFKIMSNEGLPFVARLLCDNYTEKNNVVWSYLYTDKGLYLPTDTLRVWGLVKPREKGTQIPQKGVLKLFKSNYNGIDSVVPLEIVDLDLSGLGTFTTQIGLENYTSGSYFIQTEVDGKVTGTKYFEVRQYAKPAYQITAKPDKTTAYIWDKIGIDIQTGFFEGTPVSNLSLAITTSENSNSSIISTDKQGKAHFDIIPAERYQSWRPVSIYYQIGNNHAQDQEIGINGDIMLFPRDLMFETNVKDKGNTAKVEVETHKIDIKKINDKNAAWIDPGQYRGEAVSTNLMAQVYETTWQKVENGQTYYDYINKLVVKLYDYSPLTTLIKTENITTGNGKYSFEVPVDKSKYYYVVLTGNDTRGGNISEKVDFWPQQYPYEAVKKYFYLDNTTGKQSFKTGDTVSLRVESNNMAVDVPANGKILYMTLKDGLKGYQVKKDSEYSFKMEDEYIPNIFVGAVYFDGTNIYYVYPVEIDYDYNQKKLEISVKTDKSSYKPGDTVKLDIETKDSTGKPRSAEVNISGVDEAFFAVQDQWVDILNELYTRCFGTGIYSDFVSYRQYDLQNGTPMAEKGGEGGEQYLRMDFKDSAVFKSVTTNDRGKASISFKLPDNLTSWRITYQGVTDDLLAGNGKIDVEAKIPYFVDVITNDTYISGDTASLILRSYGTLLENDAKVDYTVTLESSSGKPQTINASAKGNNMVNIDLGSLKSGDYTLTVKGMSGKLSDAIKKNISVVDSVLKSARTDYYKLSEGLKIDSGDAMTTLTFYNDSTSLLYNALNSLRYSFGNRVDQQLGRKLARELIKKYFSEAEYLSWYPDAEERIDFSSYQTEDGGIALLNYDSSDPLLTAKICSIAPDMFDTNAIEGYFRNILDNKAATPEEVSTAYWGLAAINRPVLLDIQKLLANPEGLEMKDKLYLGIALADLGDSEGAEKVFSEVVAPKIKKVEPLAYVDTGTTRDEMIETTALASMLSMKINQPDGAKLLSYVIKNSSNELLTNLEQLIYITNSTPVLNQEGSFTFDLNGKTKKVDLRKTSSYSITLKARDLANIKFSNIVGDVGVSTSFIGTVRDLASQENQLVKLRRTYIPQGSSFLQSETVTVNLHPTFLEAAPDGWYEVTEIMPAGFRFVKAIWDYECNWYFVSQEGQKVTFNYYYKRGDKLKDISYSARCVSTGQFTADNAIIKHDSSNALGFADRQKITIEEK